MWCCVVVAVESIMNLWSGKVRGPSTGVKVVVGVECPYTWAGDISTASIYFSSGNACNSARPLPRPVPPGPVGRVEGVFRGVGMEDYDD